MAQSVAPISNHDELENLAYADAGHTGFAAPADVPVEPGTGVGSMQSKPRIGTGQITLTNGSTTLTGIGTQFIGDEGVTTLSYWWQIFVAGTTYYIDDITSETAAVLSASWAGSTQTIDLVFASNAVTGELAEGFGLENNVSGLYGCSIGFEVFSRASCEVAVGIYNTDYTAANNNTDRVFVVGNGTDEGNRSNAFIVRKNGNAELSGMLTAAQLTVTGTVDFSGQTAVVDPDAVTVTGTAGALYTTTEQDMINALKADVIALRATVLALTNALQAIGFN